MRRCAGWTVSSLAYQRLGAVAHRPPGRLVTVDGLGERVRALTDQVEHLLVVVTVEGREAAQQDVEDDAERPHVDSVAVRRTRRLLGLVGGVPGQDLGRGVVGRAAQPSQRLLGRAVPSVAKVDQLDRGIVGAPVEDEIVGLEVAMHDALLVKIGDCAHDLQTEGR